jgi:hypothetical protein
MAGSMAGPRETPVRASIAVVALAASGCTYDFDAPFADEAASQSAGQGGAASGSTGASVGQGGEGNDGEDCENGVDDDADGAIDCADDACLAAGYICAPAAPAGFEGPVALVRGAPDVEPTCGGAFPEEVVAGGLGSLDAEPPACAACTCGTPDIACAAALSWFADAACGTELDAIEVASGGCVELSSGDVAAAIASSATPTGSCTATGGQPEHEPATFETSAKLCAAPLGAGCTGGVCVTRPDAPFDAQLCVYRSGVGDCSAAGPFTVALEMHGSVDDQRECTPCTCGAITGATCAGTTTIYRNNASCNGTSVVLAHDDGCASAESIRSYETALAPSGGSCAADGGDAEGDAFATDPITLCCLP